MYIIKTETFIKIDLLKHLEISRQTYPTNQSKIRATTFWLSWRYANFSISMRTIHISMTGTFQCEYCQCFTLKRCDKFKLQCTSHGGMYWFWSGLGLQKKDLGSKATPKLIRLLTNRKKVIGNYFNLLNFISKANDECNCAMFVYWMRTLSQ